MSWQSRHNTRIIGQTNERIAERFYLGKGYGVVARNFRCRLGEIDLLLWRGSELLVVEVKGRRVYNPDEAWLTRWRRKKHRLRETLRWFLADYPDWYGRVDEFRVEIVFVTQGRVFERFQDETFL